VFAAGLVIGLDTGFDKGATHGMNKVYDTNINYGPSDIEECSIDLTYRTLADAYIHSEIGEGVMEDNIWHWATEQAFVTHKVRTFWLLCRATKLKSSFNNQQGDTRCQLLLQKTNTET